MEETILTIKETALYLNCSTSTLRKLIRNGVIPYFKLGVKYYFRASKIKEWIEKNEKH